VQWPFDHDETFCAGRSIRLFRPAANISLVAAGETPATTANGTTDNSEMRRQAASAGVAG